MIEKNGRFYNNDYRDITTEVLYQRMVKEREQQKIELAKVALLALLVDAHQIK